MEVLFLKNRRNGNRNVIFEKYGNEKGRHTQILKNWWNGNENEIRSLSRKVMRMRYPRFIATLTSQ